MVSKSRVLDRAASVVSLLLVAILTWTALRGVPDPVPPPRGLDALLAPVTEVVILVWCAVTAVLVPGFLRGARGAFGVGLGLNLAYLAISVPGVHWFAIGMHTAAAVYCAVRLWARDVSEEPLRPS